MGMEFSEFPTEIFESVNLRFLGVKCHSRIPKGISRLWNLQTLIGYCRFDAASLWQLSELRNLKVYGFELLKNEEMNDCVMKKLQMISDTKITKEASTWDGFFKSIPNVKKLAINDEFQSASKAIDLSDLHKLEILRFSCMITSSNCRSQVIFPCKIRKLVLFKCVINSGVLSSLCALHKLIRGCKFESEVGTCDAEWEAADEDEFRSLQFLYLEWLPLERWRADETNFPRLHHLRVDNCIYLEEIPSGIGEIPTLQLIDLQECSESAKRIEEEQQSEYDNYDLKIRIANTPRR